MERVYVIMLTHSCGVFTTGNSVTHTWLMISGELDQCALETSVCPLQGKGSQYRRGLPEGVALSCLDGILKCGACQIQGAGCES